MSTTVTLQDVTDAETFLVDFVSSKIVDGDYTEGAALRDLAIKAIAYIFAYLRKIDSQIRARQSLKSIGSIDVTDDAEAANDAVDEILSNWFATRQQGRYTRLSAYGHATARVDIDIQPSIRFYKTGGVAFMVDYNNEAYRIPSEELMAQYDHRGELIDYTFRIPLVAEAPGSDYNILPGRFVSFDTFNAYVTYVEALEQAQGGEDIEDNEAFIARSQNLATVRNLINARSCDAVLRDTYPDVKELSVIGMGDNEMVRDYVKDAATGLAFHAGGHQDIYINQDIIETTFSGAVGGRFALPGNRIIVFRDPVYMDGGLYRKFTGFKYDPLNGGEAVKVVLPGMVLRIWEGLAVSAGDYMIRVVKDTELYVSERVPFPIATDELSSPPSVSWSLGVQGPNYDDLLSTQTTGETSRQIQTSGRIVLPGGPLYLIKEVSIEDASDPDADPTDNRVYFNVRTNVSPLPHVAPDNEYQVVVHNPEEHQSLRSYAELIVGPEGDEDKYDGKTCRVVYDTLAGFATISDFVTERRQRITGANPLVKAYHPAYIQCAIEYRLRRNVTTPLDVTAAAQAVVLFINAFPSTEVLDVSAITDFLRRSYPEIGIVYPFTIQYALHIPDGRVIDFETADAVTVPSDPVALENLLVSPSYLSDGLTTPLDYGLTDDVIRYLTRDGDVSITQRL